MVFTKGQKSDQGKFVRKFVGIIITIAFISVAPTGGVL